MDRHTNEHDQMGLSGGGAFLYVPGQVYPESDLSYAEVSMMVLDAEADPEAFEVAKQFALVTSGERESLGWLLGGFDELEAAVAAADARYRKYWLSTNEDRYTKGWRTRTAAELRALRQALKDHNTMFQGQANDFSEAMAAYCKANLGVPYIRIGGTNFDYASGFMCREIPDRHFPTPVIYGYGERISQRLSQLRYSVHTRFHKKLKVRQATRDEWLDLLGWLDLSTRF
jgi:pimeloyl-ACP methyl ester carboxylesterase